MIKIHNILRIIQLRDNLLADLHCKFGDKYTGFFEFWYNLAAIEIAHAKSVQAMEEELSSNPTIALKRGDSFIGDDIAESLEQFFKFLSSNIGKYTFEDAVRISYMLEKESLDYCQVDYSQITDSTVINIFNNLENETMSRIESVRELATEYGLNIDDNSDVDFVALTAKSLAPIEDKADAQTLKVTVAEAMTMFEKVTTTLNKPVGEVFKDSMVTLNKPIPELIKDSMKSSVEKLLEKNRQLREDFYILAQALAVVSQNAVDNYEENGKEFQIDINE